MLEEKMYQDDLRYDYVGKRFTEQRGSGVLCVVKNNFTTKLYDKIWWTETMR